MSKDADDPVVRLVAKTQYVDWRKRRLLDASSSEHRTAVHELAVEIDRISREVADTPDNVAVLPIGREPERKPRRKPAKKPAKKRATTADAKSETRPDTRPPTEPRDEEAPDEEAPGKLDLIAEAEEAMPKLQSTIEEMAACLNEVGDVSRSNKEALDRAVKQNKMGPRLAVIRKTATELDGPAQRFLDLSTEYASHVIDLNAGIDALTNLQPYGEMSPNDQAEFLSLANSIRSMRDASVEALAAVQSAAETFQEIGSLSRDMRKPTSKLQRGIERMGDVQGTYDEWVRGFERSGVWGNTDGDTDTDEESK